MFDRFTSTIRRIGSHRSGLDAYLGGVQMGECSCGPKYDEARRDFNNRIRTEFRGFLG